MVGANIWFSQRWVIMGRPVEWLMDDFLMADFF